MTRRRRRFLQRIKTFYNPIADIEDNSDYDLEEEEEVDEPDNLENMAATSAEIETLMKKYTTQKVKLHALEPFTFGGSINENSRDWIKKFENYTTLNKTPEADKLIMFETLLTKSASCWFTNLKEDKKKTWIVLKKQFEDTYFNSNSWVNSQRIENRKLRPGETCSNYINDLIELSQLTGLSDSELSKAILRGLPSSLRHQVVAHNPQTINETVQRVILSEAMMNESSPDAVCTLDDSAITSKLDSFVNTLTSSLDGIEKSFKNYKDLAENVSKNNSINATHPTIRCTICGKTNHTEENCFSKQCSICGKRNHTADTCFYKQQNNGQFRFNQRPRGRRQYRNGFQRQGFQQQMRPQYYDAQQMQFQPTQQMQFQPTQF
ncbi:MAG: hypothetical protein OCD76_09695, partial [Reichenbachiella sp.]